MRLGRLLQPGDILLFIGEFGAGKTTFIQGIAEGLGVKGPITSPSYILINEYLSDKEHGGMPFYHIDLYRIESVEEALALGMEEYLYGEGASAVEWADRIAKIAPKEHLSVDLSFLSDTKRVVRIEPLGKRYIELVEAFKQSAFG
jgi:tRNA threonylcarbamoyladenosine biosynthesis protein TsaE